MEPLSSSNPTTTSEIRATPHSPDMTPPTRRVHFSSHPTDASPTAVVAAAPKDITSTATLSHSLEGNEQQDSDIVAGPETSQVLSTAPTHAPATAPTLAPIPTSVSNTLSESYNAGVAFFSNSSHFVPPFISSTITTSRPTSRTTHPHPRAHGIVNTRNICFANAVFQLLVNSPPFWNLFRELADLTRQRGAGLPGASGATPLVDATVRFFNEFVVDEESPSAQQQSQPSTVGISRADEENDDSVVDSLEQTYMYDTMMEKRQLEPLLVRSRAHIATSY